MKQAIRRGLMVSLLLSVGAFGSSVSAFSYASLTAASGTAVEAPVKETKASAAKAVAQPEAPKAAATKEKEKASPVKEEPLMKINAAPLKAEDFSFYGVTLGDAGKVMTALKGNPTAIHHGNLQDTYTWDGVQMRVYGDFLSKYMNRKDLPVDQVIPTKGISDFYVTGGDFTTPRGIKVGSRRENVLRHYGKPDEVLWDGEKKSFLLSYSGYKKEMTFIIHEDKVQEIHLGWKETKPLGLQKGYLEIHSRNFLPEKDFSLAGLSLHQAFKDYAFSEWEKKMTNPQEEVWYYPGYAVRMTKKEKMICAIFLTDHRMLTSRGLAMGDDATTVELLYGAPHKIEMDNSAGVPRTAYIYFNRAKDKVLLIYLKNKQVDGVVVADNPQKKSK